MNARRMVEACLVAAALVAAPAAADTTLEEWVRKAKSPGEVTVGDVLETVSALVAENASLRQRLERQSDDQRFATSLAVPVGAVVPFSLSPEQIKALEPYWLPADGRVVADEGSQLHGQRLPDMTGRFALGAGAGTDVRGSRPELEGPATTTGRLAVTGATATETLTNVTVLTVGTPPPYHFLLDTITNETAWAKHTHALAGAEASAPFRRLVYLVRVKDATPSPVAAAKR